MQKEEQRKAALALVDAVWRGVDWEKVGGRRRMGIYTEFTNKVRSAAYVADLHLFINRLAGKMGSTPQPGDGVSAALSLAPDGQAGVLGVLRTEAITVVMRLRGLLEVRKEARDASGQTQHRPPPDKSGAGGHGDKSFPF